MAKVIILLRIRFVHADRDRVDDAFKVRCRRPAPDQIRQAIGVEPDLLAVLGLDVARQFRQLRQPLRRLSVAAEHDLVISAHIPALEFFFYFLNAWIFFQHKAVRVAE